MTHALHRSPRIDPEFAASGEGLMLTLADGRRVIDAAGDPCLTTPPTDLSGLLE